MILRLQFLLSGTGTLNYNFILFTCSTMPAMALGVELSTVTEADVIVAPVVT